MITRLLPHYLRTYRKRSGLAQHELAVLLGCEHRAKVSRYERGHREPMLATLIAYEIIFRVPLRALFAGLYHDAQALLKSRARKLRRRIRGRPRLTLADERKLDLLSRIINDLPTAKL